jgi:hypothetical protein
MRKFADKLIILFDALYLLFWFFVHKAVAVDGDTR